VNIGIIGAGAIGGLLAAKWAAGGHVVSLANSRGPASLADLAAKIGVRAVTVEEAVRGAEVVVVSIPEKSVPLLPKGLFRGVSAEVVVADTGNYYPSFRDGEIAAIEGGMTESEWVAEQLGRPVSKVFNNIMAHSLAEGGLPAGAPGRIALPIAGDDARAKEIFVGLVDELGFDGIDAGPLRESWRQQPGSPAYCTDYDAAGLRRALAKANRARLPEARERSIAQMVKLPAGTTPQEMVRLVREIQDAATA
jgi:8-hydroxy-5-deazaflavin:NADPH oxidoreductase